VSRDGNTKRVVKQRLSRRAEVMAVPIVVPVSMAAVFRLLRRHLDRRHAYNVGFLVYWLGWCTVFPIWAVGKRRCLSVLLRGRQPNPSHIALLTLPVIGAIGTELWPYRRSIDRDVAVVMIASAAVNAVGEELLWRGMFLEELGDNVLQGAVWPLSGFVMWHLAPQIVLPSRHGRTRFLLAAGVVGAANSLVAWRAKGLRWTLLSHMLTDACGVRVARFRLGR
jgi:Type II CAAX prenyl endopeptidase Rce1-like